LIQAHDPVIQTTPAFHTVIIVLAINFTIKGTCWGKYDTVSIRTVIHLDIPYSPDAYLQETGRAGRDGSAVGATLLYSAEDLLFAETLSTTPGNSLEDLPGPRRPAPLAAERYTRMLDYALDTSRCRRQQLPPGAAAAGSSCSASSARSRVPAAAVMSATAGC
jgi:hypothetical protein